jgi:hypothetical protein
MAAHLFASGDVDEPVLHPAFKISAARTTWSAVL